MGLGLVSVWVGFGVRVREMVRVEFRVRVEVVMQRALSAGTVLPTNAYLHSVILLYIFIMHTYLHI